MKKRLTGLLLLSSLAISGCATMGDGSLARVVSDEVAASCSMIVGGVVKSRIDSEWAKYPDVAVTRPIIENVSQVILTAPGLTDAQRLQTYKDYMSCATGVYLAKGASAITSGQ